MNTVDYGSDLQNDDAIEKQCQKQPVRRLALKRPPIE